MRIVDVSARLVRVPLRAPIHWRLGRLTHATRLIYELRTDEGITGVGESYYVPDAERLLRLASEALAGLEPLATGLVGPRLDRFEGEYETLMPAGLRAGIEMACLDAAGRALGVPVATLLGGAQRADVPAAAYVFPERRDASADELAARAEALVARFGFGVVKLKGGIGAPEDDVAAIRAIAGRLPGVRLRLDPNAAWSVAAAVGVAEALRADGLHLEYLEDPVPDLEGMAQVRRRTTVPLATNMCVVAFEQLAPAVRLGSVDVVLADPHYWGGFRAVQRMIAVCDAFRLGVGMHSDNDLGISTAARLHLAVAAPSIAHAIDSHHSAEHHDDLVVEPLEPTGGAFTLPVGPGLGVQLDRDAVRRYAVE
jgi:glucarate dehydratase